MNNKSLFDLINEIETESDDECVQRSNNGLALMIDRLYLAIGKYGLDSIEELIDLLENNLIDIKTNNKKGRKLKWTDHYHALLRLEVDIVMLDGLLTKDAAFLRLSQSQYWNKFIQKQEASYNPDLSQSIKKQYNNGLNIESVQELFHQYVEDFCLKNTQQDKINFIKELRNTQPRKN